MAAPRSRTVPPSVGVKGDLMKRRAWALLLLGGLAGGLLLTPAGAHVTDSVRHLWRDHIKSKADTRYAVGCYPDTSYYPRAGVCLEGDDRPSEPWRDAVVTCDLADSAGRRLPTLNELDVLRQTTGVTLGTNAEPYELTSEYAGHAEGPGHQVYVLQDDGDISTVSFAAGGPFRCVDERTNKAEST